VSAATGTYVNNLENLNRKGVYAMFGVVSNEFNTPKILLCPAEFDTDKKQATLFFGGPSVQAPQVPYDNDGNVSFFVGVDAYDTQPAMWLTGDHNLALTFGNPPNQQIRVFGHDYSWHFVLTTNRPTLTWPDTQHQKQGNIGLADGSVQSMSIRGLSLGIQNTGDPGVTTGGPGAFSAGANRMQFPARQSAPSGPGI
jgi:prepilin-type processing-associated H-X9-DG protein